MSGHGHTLHVGGHGGEGSGEHIPGFRLELVIALLLGLAAIVGALATYLGHVSEGHSINGSTRRYGASTTPTSSTRRATSG